MKSLGAFGVAVLLGAIGAVTGVSAASATDDPPQYTVDLHNTEAGLGTCPSSVEGEAWHFVAPPVSATDFIAITLTLDNGDNTTSDIIITQWDEIPGSGHAYVEVPAGYTADDLVGGTFVITGSDSDVRLSHICGTPPDDDEVEHLTVTKTVDTSYTRTYLWDLEKTVSTNSVKLYIPGEGPSTGTVDWTVAVTAGEYIDSAESITGTVTIENDGDLTAVIAQPTDTFSVDGVGDVPVALDCGAVTFPYVLVVGATLECTYEIDGQGKPTGTNSASVQASVVYTSGDVDVAWGDPDSEVNKTVTVEDISDIEPSPRSDTFTWPDGGSITYSNEFDWNDYGVVHDTNCGPFVYDNTATLTGDGDVVLDTDSESVTVNVQCYVSQGETGWASGTKYPGQSSWAMYASKEALWSGVTIYAGQHFAAGTATLSGTTLTIALTGGWEFSDAAASLKVQSYKNAPAPGNVQVGKFETKLNATGTSAVVTVKANNYYGIHLDLERWIPDPNF